MKKNVLFTVLSLCTAFQAYAESSPTYVARSQGRDAARKLVGNTENTHLYQDGKYTTLNATVEYARSFRSNRIAECLFGDDVDNCGKILIQGSSVEDRNAKAWLADYFYLPPDYNSYFTVEPVIQSALIDLDLFMGLDSVAKGMYLRLHGPITWTRWKLNFSEPCDQETTGSYNYGYFDRGQILNNQLLGKFGDYAQGNSPLNTLGTTAQPAIGVEFQGLNYAQIDTCDHSRTGFADLRMELGYDFAQDDDYHFGVSAQVAAPTGNRTEARRAFDSTVGNRNHWEVGGGLSAHYTFWRAQAEDKHAGFYIDANITHINKATEQRTFDLCGRPNSRYMLAMKLQRPVSYLTAAATSANTAPTDVTTPNSQFASVFTPVANLTTLNIQVSNAVQADIVAMFNYTGSAVSFDLGYNFWIRSTEKFSRPQQLGQCCPSLCDGSKDVWALKGDAHVFGFLTQNGATLNLNDPVALSATQCGATIHSGTNATSDSGTSSCSGVSSLTNCGVDNPEFAYGDAVRLVHTPSSDATEANHVQTSVEPRFLQCCDINLQPIRGLSHKVFAHLSYSWEMDSYTPYLGLGGFAEFGKNESKCDPCDDTPTTFDCSTPCDDSSCCETTCCSSALDCALSQWGIWIKGGVNFS